MASVPDPGIILAEFVRSFAFSFLSLFNPRLTCTYKTPIYMNHGHKKVTSGIEGLRRWMDGRDGEGMK